MERRRDDDRPRRNSRDDNPGRRDFKPPRESANQAQKRDNRIRNRSRSPARNDRRDDKRRDRSPPRGPAARPSRGNYNQRGRDFNRGGDGPPRQPQPPAARKPPAPEKPAPQIPEDEDSEAEMARVMGFKSFKTTQNTKVPGNDKNYGVNKRKKSEYRQYMNRVGGFNRPLSPSRG